MKYIITILMSMYLIGCNIITPEQKEEPIPAEAILHNTYCSDFDFCITFYEDSLLVELEGEEIGYRVYEIVDDSLRANMMIRSKLEVESTYIVLSFYDERLVMYKEEE